MRKIFVGTETNVILDYISFWLPSVFLFDILFTWENIVKYGFVYEANPVAKYIFMHYGLLATGITGFIAVCFLIFSLKRLYKLNKKVGGFLLLFIIGFYVYAFSIHIINLWLVN